MEHLRRDLKVRLPSESQPWRCVESPRIAQPLAPRRGFTSKRDPHDALPEKGELRARSRFARASQARRVIHAGSGSAVRLSDWISFVNRFLNGSSSKGRYLRWISLGRVK
jgi:hypothetical protein